jgi:hypothetical protein
VAGVRSLAAGLAVAGIGAVGALAVASGARAQTPPPLPSATVTSSSWSGETVDGVVRTATTLAAARPTTTVRKRSRPAATTTTAVTTVPPTANPTNPATNPAPADADIALPNPLPAARQDDVWYRLRVCESRNNYAINTGNGYYGAYQFALATWRSLGFTGYPHEADPDVQDAAARKLQARAGWSAWPACARKLGLR